MTHASLFSGIGGFDLAAEWAGWINLFNCEISPFCQKILKYHFPNATQYSDIKTTDFTVWRGRVDVLTGGFPCQPFSVAGKRKGTDDDRYLWPEMLRAIDEISPRFVVGENVRGIINWSGGLVFEQVCSDLETLGYEVTPFIIPACGVNAPHRRDRVWFIAHSSDAGIEAVQGRQDSVCGFGTSTDSNSNRLWGRSDKQKPIERSCSATHISTQRENGTASDTTSKGWGMRRAEGNIETHNTSERTSICERIDRLGGIGTAANPQSAGLQTRAAGSREKQPWGGGERMGIPTDWQDFPTQSPVCSRDDGFSARLDGITFPRWRAESIKGFGNAVVPEIPYQFFKIINQLCHT